MAKTSENVTNDDDYTHTRCLVALVKKFEWRHKGQLIQLHFDGLPLHLPDIHHVHTETHTHSLSSFLSCHCCPLPWVTAPANHYRALLLNGHQTVGSQQFRTLSHKTKWNPIRSRTTKINLPSDLSDQNDFRYKFSVNGLNLFLIHFLKATCKLQGQYFLDGSVSGKLAVITVSIHIRKIQFLI